MKERASLSFVFNPPFLTYIAFARWRSSFQLKHDSGICRAIVRSRRFSFNGRFINEPENQNLPLDWERSTEQESLVFSGADHAALLRGFLLQDV
jgi:hypothetical protein